MNHRILHAFWFCSIPLAVSCGGGGGGGGGGGPGLDPQNSTVRAMPLFGTEADGLSSVTITVTLIDDMGMPVVGRDVTLAISGVGGSVVQPAAPTDANGVATG